jgi:hypothetical protein
MLPVFIANQILTKFNITCFTKALKLILRAHNFSSAIHNDDFHQLCKLQTPESLPTYGYLPMYVCSCTIIPNNEYI